MEQFHTVQKRGLVFPESPLCVKIVPVILPELLDRLFIHTLLDTVENEELLQILLSTDKKTLQMVVLKMMGYAPKEISHHMELPEQTVYTRLRRLREKIKKSMKFE